MPDEDPSSLGAFEFALRFPGQYFDRETNLHYNYHRDYDPDVGGYKQSDPIGLLAGLNTYAYVGHDPLVATDELGLFEGNEAAYGQKIKPGPGLAGAFLGGLAIGTAIYETYGKEIQDAWETACDKDGERKQHRGRIQAQGNIIKPVVNESSKWAQDTPLTKAQGFVHLHRVTMMIPYRQLKRFTNAIARAATFIQNTSTVGPGKWAFTDDPVLRNLKGADRIDIEVQSGEAF